MNNNAIELSPADIMLLNISASELIPMLTEKQELLHVKQVAFSYYCKTGNQFFQVQVTVTRDSSAFLEDFQTEELSEYKNKN